MADAFYKSLRLIGRGPLGIAARVITPGVRNVPAVGPALIAPNHTSPFDVPLLIAAIPRTIDFVSITELMQKPFVGWFFRNMGAFPLERRRRDVLATRVLMDRLAAGRLVCMFPEGRIHSAQTSPLGRGEVNPNLARLARVAGVPIVPCVITGAQQSADPAAWIPVAQTRYTVAFGQPISVKAGDEANATAELRHEYARLFRGETAIPSGTTGRD